MFKRNLSPKFILTMCLLILGTTVLAQVKSSDQQIIETVRALPESFRDGAKIIGYNGAGERITLKEGTNDMICWADDPNSTSVKGAIFIVCFPKSLEPYMNRMRELASKGEAKLYIVDSEVESGKIPMPKYAIRYTLRGALPENVLPLTVMHIPFATAESTGFSTEIDNYRPWLMREGTAHAHIMIPGH